MTKNCSKKVFEFKPFCYFYKIIFILFSMKNKKLILMRAFSTFLIVSMLLTVFFVANNVNAEYTLNYDNKNVIYNGNRDSNKVSLMVNVYWGTEYIPKMLEIFKKYDVKTTFFVGGTWAEKEKDTLLQIYNEGHEIGSHGYFHLDQDKLTYEQNREEIYNTHSLIKVYLDLDMHLFAPPSGDFSNTTLEVAQALGYSTIMWSRDTIDWRDKSSELVYTRCTKGIKGGDLILMHPTEHTAAALKDVLQYYANHNLKPCTVSENLAIKSH